MLDEWASGEGLTGDFFGETEQPIYCVNLLEQITFTNFIGQ
jgi:hypothetical protein